MCFLATLVIVVAEETGLQRFEGADDDDYGAVDGAQRALARLEQVADDARDYAAHAKAPNTLKAYRIDWADFSAWCALHRLEVLPAEPQTVALYLTDLARTHKVWVSSSNGTENRSKGPAERSGALIRFA